MPNLTLNKFMQDGSLDADAGRRQVQMSEDEISMILDHAVQLMYIYYNPNNPNMMNIDSALADQIDELAQVLDETGGTPEGFL